MRINSKFMNHEKKKKNNKISIYFYVLIQINCLSVFFEM